MTDAALRAAMVRTCRAMNVRGLNQGTSGNLAVRVDEGLLITPSAVPYEELQPGQIVRMTLDGEILEGDDPPSSEWRMHAGILAARPDVDAVLHAHAMFCTTLACLHRDIPAFHYMIAVAGGDSIRCATYATVGSAALAAHALRALEGRRACLLANHGMLALASSPAGALELAIEVETLAAQYWRALQAGEPHLLSADQMAEVHERFEEYRRPRGPAQSTAASAAPAAAMAFSTATDAVPAAAGALAGSPARATAPPAARGRTRAPIDWAELGQRWMGRVGALLLLVGLAYLMKYAVDRGWLGPPLRIGFGVVTGLALLGAGLRLDADRRPYALTLLGTGIATLYLTGYAAYALYGYLGPRGAFAALAVIIALALVLARRREEQILAQIGAAGAFATPLLLGEAGGVVALSLYIAGVAGWTGALAFLHGWRSLFLTILVGSFGLLAMGASEVPPADPLPVASACVWAWAVVTLLPLLRERLGPGPGRRVRRPVPTLFRSVVAGPEALDRITIATLVPAASALLVALQSVLWDLERAGAAGVGFAAAAVVASLLPGADAAAVRARRAGVAPLLVVCAGATLLVPDDALRVALLVVAGLAAFLAPGVRSAPGADVLGHVVFAMLAAWLTAQLSDVNRPVGFFTTLAAAEVAGIVAAAVVALRGLDPRTGRLYLGAAHVSALAWVMVCARNVEGGLAWVSLLWGIYGAGLLVLAVARNLARVRLAALGTLGLVAGKLILVDTAGVDAGWRIILFIGFGAAFLALGYISNPETP